MNAEQLQAIKDRAEKATPGPWFIDGAIDVHSAQGNEVAAVWDGGYDIEFIAHAREDIPQLVAEVERCHIEIADREQSHIDLYNDYQKTKSEVERLRRKLSYICRKDIAHMIRNNGEDFYYEWVRDFEKEALK